MPDPAGSPASEFSAALLSEFVRLGVREIVLAPGSRSQALALVAAGLERAGAVRLHVRIDERGAGFLALGLAAESGTPVLVVTTSGTAVANLHPAVLEAHHSGIPVILLTADRPDEMRGIGSNQTTRQAGLFGSAVRFSDDVSAPAGAADDAARARETARHAFTAARGGSHPEPGPGPVQLNLAFREPLSAATPPAELPAAPPDHLPAPHPAETISARRRTVVVAGHGAGAEAEQLAREGGWPLLAEVSSGSRFGPNLVVSYRELLDEPEWGGMVDRVVVFGHPTLSREVPAVIQRDGVETVVVVSGGGERYNPGHRVGRFVHSLVPDDSARADARSPEARAWIGRWVVASRQLRETLDTGDEAGPDVEASRSADLAVRGGFARAELAALRTPVTRRMLVDAVWRATWPHDRLVFGASRLIREADRRVPGKKITVHANRGLAGIDGTVSTAMGVALASQAEPGQGMAGTTRVLLGDLTLLHDAGSLLVPPGETRPRLQVIVGNDGGGTIFDGLEVAATADADDVNRVLYTPQEVDLAALAAAYGWEYARAATRSDLERALTAPPPGASILEVPLAR